MSGDLIAAARRLAGAGGEPSFWDVSANRLLCTYCNGNENEQRYGGPDVQHDADCPWLALPRIVRALEAAQAVVDAYGRPVAHPFVLCWHLASGEACRRSVSCHHRYPERCEFMMHEHPPSDDPIMALRAALAGEP